MYAINSYLVQFYVFKHNQEKFENLSPQLKSPLRFKRNQAYESYKACYEAYTAFNVSNLNLDGELIHHRQHSSESVNHLLMKTQSVYQKYIFYILMQLSSESDVSTVLQECLARKYQLRPHPGALSGLEELCVEACKNRKFQIIQKLIDAKFVVFSDTFCALYDKLISANRGIFKRIQWVFHNFKEQCPPPVFLKKCITQHSSYTRLMTSLTPTSPTELKRRFRISVTAIQTISYHYLLLECIEVHLYKDLAKLVKDYIEPKDLFSNDPLFQKESFKVLSRFRYLCAKNFSTCFALASEKIESAQNDFYYSSDEDEGQLILSEIESYDSSDEEYPEEETILLTSQDLDKFSHLNLDFKDIDAIVKYNKFANHNSDNYALLRKILKEAYRVLDCYKSVKLKIAFDESYEKMFSSEFRWICEEPKVEGKLIEGLNNDRIFVIRICSARMTLYPPRIMQISDLFA